MEKVLELNTAKLMYKSGIGPVRDFALSHFSEEELQRPTFPKRWEDLGEIQGTYINGSSEISQPFEGRFPKFVPMHFNKNCVPTTENAESILALCQLLQLRDRYRELEGPSANGKPNFFLVQKGDRVDVHLTHMDTGLFLFRSEHTARTFAKNFKELLITFDKLRRY